MTIVVDELLLLFVASGLGVVGWLAAFVLVTRVSLKTLYREKVDGAFLLAISFGLFAAMFFPIVLLGWFATQGIKRGGE